MANIRINSLPADAAPNASDVAPIDGLTTRKATLTNIVNAGRPFASQAEAEAGVNTVHGMSPLTTAQAIAAQGALAFAPIGQGIPAGGTLGQVLGKVSGADFDVDWQNAGAGNLISTNNLSDVANTTTALANLGGQPVDSDLTAIAALSTTAYGRSLLTLANSSALATEIASFYQPLDSDLTAIAALTTTAYGRSLLTMAANADLRNDLDAPVYVADYAAMLALDTTKDKVAEVYAAVGRNGKFVWSSSDLSPVILGPAVTSTAVNSGTEIITKVAHGLATGQPVVTTTAVNGLSLNTLYWVIFVDVDNFKLASSLANANAGTAFNLTGTTNFSVKQHYDAASGMYVYPAADISGASGAWVRQRSSLIVYPEWCGALGDGSTDDIIAINYAVILLEVSGGGEIHFSAKRYRHSAAISITNIPILISGEGEMSTFLEQTTLNANGITFVSNSGSNASPRGFPHVNQLVIRDLSVLRAASTGGNAIDATWAITTSSTKQCVIERVRCYGTGSVSNNWAGGIKLTNCNGTVLNEVQVCGDTSQASTVVRNPYTTTFGIQLNNPTNGTGLIWHNITNTLTIATSIGLDIVGWHEGMSIKSCHFIQNEIGIQTNAGASNTSLDLFIVNTHIESRWRNILATNTFKVKLDNCDLLHAGGGAVGFVGTNVVLVSTSTVGSIFFSATGTVFSNNATVAGNNGITMDTASHHGVITGCHFTGHQGVCVSITSQFWTVVGNKFFNSGQGIILGGDGCTVGANNYSLVTTPFTNSGTNGTALTYVTYNKDQIVALAGGAAVNSATFAIPTGIFAAVPTFAMIQGGDAAAGQFFIGEFDRTASTASSAVFKVKRQDGAVITAANYRFTIMLAAQP